MYDSDLLLRRVNEQGEPVYMDESMKRREKERLEAIVRDQCGAAPTSPGSGAITRQPKPRRRFFPGRRMRGGRRRRFALLLLQTPPD